MKILVISNLYPPHYLGGYEILCEQVCKFLQSRGHDVTVLTSDYNEEISLQEQEGVHILRQLKLIASFEEKASNSKLIRRKVYYQNRKIFNEVIDSIKPDIIFLWSQLRLTVSLIRATCESGIPWVMSINDTHLEGFLPSPFRWRPKGMINWIFDSFLSKQTLKNIPLANTFVISQFLKKKVQQIGIPLKNSKVFYQGIPLDRFPFKSHPEPSLKEKKILYVGQVHPYKGVHTLLESLSHINNRSKRNISATIVGDGDPMYMNDLKKMVHTESLRVQFKGKIDHQHLASTYQEHDIFVFPSIWEEPFGLTHLEAMASGLPVISTVEGGQKEFLKDGVNCLTFEKENVVQLSSGILKLLDDPILTEKLRKKGRDTVENFFALDHYCHKIEKALFSILQD